MARTNEQRELAVQVSLAVRKMRDAVEDKDCREVVDWATTVQLRTAELVATVVNDLRNR